MKLLLKCDQDIHLEIAKSLNSVCGIFILVKAKHHMTDSKPTTMRAGQLVGPPWSGNLDYSAPNFNAKTLP